jgi:hypothetical protein
MNVYEARTKLKVPKLLFARMYMKHITNTA